MSLTTVANDTKAGSEPAELPRAIGAWSAAAVVAGMVIGSGIFRVPSSVAAEAGGVLPILVLWALGGLIALCGALALAELSTMFPRAGGQYVFLREAYGPAIAFLFGWTYLLVTPAAWAAVALIFATYLGHFFPLGDWGVRIVAGGLIVLLVLVHYRSVRLGAWIQNLSTWSKVAALIGVAAAIFLLGTPGTGAYGTPSDVAPGGMARMGIALIGIMFAYDGWAAFTSLSGEVRDPARNLPRALIGGMMTVMAVYVLVNAAYLYALPVGEMAASPMVATDAATRVIGAGGASLIAALVVLSTFGALNAIVMSDPRIFFAMSRDRLFFRGLAAVHPRFLTPHRSIVFTGAIALLYTFVRTFEQLAEAFIVGIWPFLALMVAGVIVLRRRRPELERPYRTLAYPLPQLLFILASVLLIGNALAEHPVTTLFSFGISALGLPVYLLWRRRARVS
jgi:basic amino acid/polyamine antiporter, APA family